MANQSTSNKSLRSFQVRDGLWKLFEVKSREMDCSVDYLINEAMRLYARTHNFASSVRVEGRPTGNYSTATPGPQPPGVPRPGGVPPVRPSIQPAPAPIPRPGSGPAPSPITGAGHVPVSTGQYSGMPSHVPSAQPPMPTSSHVPMPGGTGPAIPRPPEVTGRPTLTMIFQGRKLPITTTQFIIGRGSKSSDLAIKDPNISRKHAAIIFHNGAFYIKDLGSTNGIEYKGKQVDSKRIDEGDVFTICGYDLHFTYSV